MVVHERHFVDPDHPAIHTQLIENTWMRHERHFVDPDHPAIHTQLIENTWMRAKKKLRRQHGTSVDLFSSYIAEFMWRSRVGENKFAEFLLAIRQLYPL